MRLKTSRLTLRTFEDSDYDSLVSMMTDAEVMQFTGFKKPQTEEKIRELLAKWKAEGQGELGVWAVIASDSKAFVGWSMLKRIKTDVPELGYMIAKEHWGQGYATELARALAEHARVSLKLPKIVAVTSPENFASVKILEKIGMKRVSDSIREDGGVDYEILFF